MAKNTKSKYQKPLLSRTWGKMKRLIPILMVVFALSFSTAVDAQPNLKIPSKYKDLDFQKITVGDKDIYFAYQIFSDNKHTIKVMDSSIIVQATKDTKNILKVKDTLRKDIKKDVLKRITIEKEDLKDIIDTPIESAEYYILSKSSPVFENIKTNNPVLVVYTKNQYSHTDIIVIDATNGENLGKAVPPPSPKSFTLTGPSYQGPCAYGWTTWLDNANSWFDQMGYTPEKIIWPSESEVQTHVESHTSGVLFYEMAHGGEDYFKSGCINGQTYETTYASEIETWMQNYEKVGFTFIGSCNGMCNTGDNTLSYEFRKGSVEDTTTVGYCGMGGQQCQDCWYKSYLWQDKLFEYMNQGDTVYEAFNKAMADYPTCQVNDCMRFAGDESYKVKPEIKNREYNCGDLISDDATLYEGLSDCSEGLIVDKNSITIDCQNFTIDGVNANSGIELKNKSGITIKNCKIQEFDNGILLEESTNNQIHTNEFKDNTYGVYLRLSSDYNQIWNNRFLLNNSAYEERADNNKWTVNKIGNYWYDYNKKIPGDAVDILFNAYEIPGEGNGVDYAPLGRFKIAY
jgi:parallel beta-helix repeat protein